MKKFIKLLYQVPRTDFFLGNTSRTIYEIKTCYQEVNESISDRENIDNAFSKACELGADPNKNIKWSTITETEYVKEIFEIIKNDIPILCKKWGKKQPNGQYLYGDVLDYIRDNFNEIYRSKSCDILARLIIGEFVIKTCAL